MKNPVIQNYMNDKSIPYEKRKFAQGEIMKGNSEKVLLSIKSIYGNKYDPLPPNQKAYNELVKSSPIGSVIEKAKNAFMQGWEQTRQGTDDFIDSLNPSYPMSGRERVGKFVGGGVNALSGAIGATFSPLTGAIEETPVLGEASEAIGGAMEWGTDKTSEIIAKGAEAMGVPMTEEEQKTLKDTLNLGIQLYTMKKAPKGAKALDELGAKGKPIVSEAVSGASQVAGTVAEGALAGVGWIKKKTVDATELTARAFGKIDKNTAQQIRNNPLYREMKEGGEAIQSSFYRDLFDGIKEKRSKSPEKDWGLRQLEDAFLPEDRKSATNLKIRKDAIDRLYNLTLPANKKHLALVEEIMPDFANQVKAMKALENVRIATNPTVTIDKLWSGAVRSAVGFSAGGIAGSVAGLLLSPKNVIWALERYSRKSKMDMSKIILRIREGKKLTKSQQDIVSDLLISILKVGTEGAVIGGVFSGEQASPIRSEQADE